MGVKVRQKVKGKGKPWWIFVNFQNQRCSRKVGDKKAAEAVASKIRAKIKLGEFDFFDNEPVPTFKHYADSWINTTVPATCKRSTKSDYEDILRVHVMPVFKDMPITQITRGKIRDFLFGKANEGYASSTVTHIRNVISGVLNKAVDDEVIPANPSHRMGKIGKSSDRRENINPLSRDELNTLLITAYRHFPREFPLLLTLARTGMRIGEALGLKWNDIDFEGRSIDIQRSFVRSRISTPKSGKYRTVDTTPQLVETLKRHRTKQMRDALANGRGELPEWVFTTQDGKLIELYRWRKGVFKNVLKKAKLRTIRIHDLRHSYATLRISKGDNIADVSKQLGHHSVKLTMDVYYHWIPGTKKSEVDELDSPILSHLSAPHPHPETRKGQAVLANPL